MKTRFNGSPTADGYYTTLDETKVNRTDGEKYISPYSVLFFNDGCCAPCICDYRRSHELFKTQN